MKFRFVAFVTVSLLAGAAFPGCKAKATATTPTTTTVTATPSALPTVTPSPGAPSSVRIDWTPSRERAVNQAGGGYRVYYSTTLGFPISGAASIDVPYVSGAQAPHTATLTNLAPATYYFKIVAYSALVPPGGTATAVSQPSSQISITVP